MEHDMPEEYSCDCQEKRRERGLRKAGLCLSVLGVPIQMFTNTVLCGQYARRVGRQL